MAAIEIPFGARDSELMGWEYTIPEDMEAVIKDGKVIVKKKESEDEKNERIKKFITETIFCQYGDSQEYLDVLAYLEKQKDCCGKTLIRDSGESACSYIERCLTPEMRKIWYEACAEIKEKQKEQIPYTDFVIW